MPNLLWFRDDLRLADNPALSAAVEQGEPFVCLYVLDEVSPGVRPLGAASRWWLHYSLAGLGADLSRRGQRLIVRKGAAARIVPSLARSIKAGRVFWNRRYGAAADVDATVEAALRRSRIPMDAFQASLLFEPQDLRSGAGKPFSVHSAFWRRALSNGEPRLPLPAPKKLPPPPKASIESDAPGKLNLLPVAPDWSGGIRASWQPGEAGAQQRLAGFVAARLAGYAGDHDRMDVYSTGRLSPHLRFGEVSPFQIWHALGGAGRKAAASVAKFRSELGWREFAWHVFDANRGMARRNIRPAFDRMSLEEPYEDEMWAWRRGRTGYPIVDAGMRQLWEMGWMHNRARMITASFLAKHLLVDWRIGEEWFWDTLVDADPASNPFNWQWVAGTGADAQPFFRIFNPVTQGETFDPEGAYVRRFVPELRLMPTRYIHQPWRAPARVLAKAGVVLGDTYPLPIVEHSAARARALNAFAQIGRKAERRNLEGSVLSQ